MYKIKAGWKEISFVDTTDMELVRKGQLISGGTYEEWKSRSELDDSNYRVEKKSKTKYLQWVDATTSMLVY